MPTNDPLVPISDSACVCGFSNLLSKESGLWWKTSKWWVQGLIWLLISNGFLALFLWAVPEEHTEKVPPLLQSFGMFVATQGFFAAAGVIVLTHGAIAGEKRTGSAAWIMSNPVSRSAFILSKLAGQAGGIFAIVLGLQGVIAYSQISLKLGSPIPLLPCFEAMALLALHTLFYLTLVLMLGAFFKGRGPVLGIAFALLLGQEIAEKIIKTYVPRMPTVIPERVAEAAVAVVVGEPMAADWYIPVIVAAVMSVLFVLGAIWRFTREEF